MAKREKRVLKRGRIGFFGYHVGSGIHIIDIHGLADPLLARLPARKSWRVGHYERSLPDGYLESIAQGRNLIRDKDLEVYSAILGVLARGEIFDWSRLALIWKMNTGQFDSLLDSWIETMPMPEVRTLDDFQVQVSKTGALRLEGPELELPGDGLLIVLDRVRVDRLFEAVLSADCGYEIFFYFWELAIGNGKIPRLAQSGLRPVRSDLSGFLGERGYNRILIEPRGDGEGVCRLGPIELSPR